MRATPRDPGGGLAIVVTDSITARYLLGGQLSHLAGAGLDVWLAASPGPHLDAVRREQGIRCFPVSMRREIRPFSDLASLVRLVRLFRRQRPVAVSASTPKAGLLGMIAAALARVPVRIYTVRGLRLETAHGLKRAVLSLSERLAARLAHQVVLVSESLRSEYLRRGLAAERKTRVLGSGSSNGVDCEHFSPRRDPARRRTLAARVALDPEEPIVGFIGRLVRDKGIEDLVEALAGVVRPRLPTAQLLVIGDFESGDPVSREVRAHLVEDPGTALAGFVEDTAPWYELIDVLAFPSYREGFPNAPLEAAASALPVAGYAATGTVDAVVEATTGTLVPVGDVRALGEAICRYLESPELRRAHGAAARHRVEERFSQQAVWSAWLDFYRELLSGASTEGQSR